VAGSSRLRQLVKSALTRVGAPFEARFGPPGRIRAHRSRLEALPSIPESIRRFDARWPADVEPPDDTPIFILSAGWRSGSTMLQRLVLSSGRVLIWGEPYDHCDVIRRLAESLRAFDAEYPPDDFLLSSHAEDEDLSGEWVANLYPHPHAVRAAHRAQLAALFAEPAREAGYAQWGVKEVRLGIEHAAYLKWLYPSSRFLLLYRDPYAAYRSFRRFRGWYDRYPDEPVLTARQFGAVWRRLTEGFVRDFEQVGGCLVSFEELTREPATVSRLSDYLGLTLNPDALSRRIAGRGDVRPQPVPRAELRLLKKEVEPLASRLGYTS